MSDFSFPSSHSAVVAAVAAGLVFVNTRLAVLGVLAAVAMGLSRVYVGAHYPHDVLAGLVLGAVVGVGTIAVAWRYATPLVVRLRRSRLQPLLVTGPAQAPHARWEPRRRATWFAPRVAPGGHPGGARPGPDVDQGPWCADHQGGTELGDGVEPGCPGHQRRPG